MRFALPSTSSFPVRVTVNSERVGSRQNFGRAVAACSGGLIALCDQDDVWVPGKLRLLEAAMSDAPDAILAFSDADVVDERLEPLGFSLWDHLGIDDSLRGLVRQGEAFPRLLVANFVTGSTVMFRADLRSCLPIPADLPFTEHDGWLALGASVTGGIVPVAEKLIAYRQHSDQQIGVGPGRRMPPGASTPRHLPIDEAIRVLSALTRRLEEAPLAPAGGDRAWMLTDRLAHYRFRTGLPDSPARRVFAVGRELRTRRYARYSRGLRSAAKDMVLGAPRDSAAAGPSHHRRVAP